MGTPATETHNAAKLERMLYLLFIVVSNVYFTVATGLLSVIQQLLHNPHMLTVAMFTELFYFRERT